MLLESYKGLLEKGEHILAEKAMVEGLPNELSLVRGVFCRW
jgi:hypothetical protein